MSGTRSRNRHNNNPSQKRLSQHDQPSTSKQNLSSPYGNCSEPVQEYTHKYYMMQIPTKLSSQRKFSKFLEDRNLLEGTSYLLEVQATEQQAILYTNGPIPNFDNWKECLKCCIGRSIIQIHRYKPWDFMDPDTSTTAQSPKNSELTEQNTITASHSMVNNPSELQTNPTEIDDNNLSVVAQCSEMSDAEFDSVLRDFPTEFDTKCASISNMHIQKEKQMKQEEKALSRHDQPSTSEQNISSPSGNSTEPVQEYTHKYYMIQIPTRLSSQRKFSKLLKDSNLLEGIPFLLEVQATEQQAILYTNGPIPDLENWNICIGRSIIQIHRHKPLGFIDPDTSLNTITSSHSRVNNPSELQTNPTEIEDDNLSVAPQYPEILEFTRVLTKYITEIVTKCAQISNIHSQNENQMKQEEKTLSQHGQPSTSEQNLSSPYGNAAEAVLEYTHRYYMIQIPTRLSSQRNFSKLLEDHNLLEGIPYLLEVQATEQQAIIYTNGPIPDLENWKHWLKCCIGRSIIQIHRYKPWNFIEPDTYSELTEQNTITCSHSRVNNPSELQTNPTEIEYVKPVQEYTHKYYMIQIPTRLSSQRTFSKLLEDRNLLEGIPYLLEVQATEQQAILYTNGPIPNFDNWKDCLKCCIGRSIIQIHRYKPWNFIDPDTSTTPQNQKNFELTEQNTITPSHSSPRLFLYPVFPAVPITPNTPTSTPIHTQSSTRYPTPHPQPSTTPTHNAQPPVHHTQPSTDYIKYRIKYIPQDICQQRLFYQLILTNNLVPNLYSIKVFPYKKTASLWTFHYIDHKVLTANLRQITGDISISISPKCKIQSQAANNPNPAKHQTNFHLVISGVDKDYSLKDIKECLSEENRFPFTKIARIIGRSTKSRTSLVRVFTNSETMYDDALLNGIRMYGKRLNCRIPKASSGVPIRPKNCCKSGDVS
ncbi:uncharacterized protein LOC114329485 [Diabrotica virgifera virgifera]|uniref:Uncharacterized protein LOC114329485 isoform X1 n=1 Tax=Diabrotica virgifera virgifera TaxID=50390 RepID=A0A6P7FEG0_DIAVI|nr:uncharacterized protein LOC114329485 [Diabrotica virgifera virgifera]